MLSFISLLLGLAIERALIICKKYKDLMPTRKFIEEEMFLFIDGTAPVLAGTPADIGLAFCLGDNPAFKSSMNFLDKLKRKIPGGCLNSNCASGEKVYQWINQMIEKEVMMEVISFTLFGVLAHRLYDVPFENLPGVFKPFYTGKLIGLSFHADFIVKQFLAIRI